MALPASVTTTAGGGCFLVVSLVSLLLRTLSLAQEKQERLSCIVLVDSLLKQCLYGV